MKPGLKTTEFWLALVVSLIAAAMTHFEQVDGTVGVVVMGILGTTYTLLRSALKSKQ